MNRDLVETARAEVNSFLASRTEARVSDLLAHLKNEHRIGVTHRWAQRSLRQAGWVRRTRRLYQAEPVWTPRQPDVVALDEEPAGSPLPVRPQLDNVFELTDGIRVTVGRHLAGLGSRPFAIETVELARKGGEHSHRFLMTVDGWPFTVIVIAGKADR